MCTKIESTGLVMEKLEHLADPVAAVCEWADHVQERHFGLKMKMEPETMVWLLMRIHRLMRSFRHEPITKKLVQRLRHMVSAQVMHAYQRGMFDAPTDGVEAYIIDRMILLNDEPLQKWWERLGGDYAW